MAKINKTKTWFFEKINKTDKAITRLINKKAEDSYRNEKEKLQPPPQKYKS